LPSDVVFYVVIKSCHFCCQLMMFFDIVNRSFLKFFLCVVIWVPGTGIIGNFIPGFYSPVPILCSFHVSYGFID
jgi:hypothetical protein